MDCEQSINLQKIITNLIWIFSQMHKLGLWHFFGIKVQANVFKIFHFVCMHALTDKTINTYFTIVKFSIALFCLILIINPVFNGIVYSYISLLGKSLLHYHAENISLRIYFKYPNKKMLKTCTDIFLLLD